MSELKQYTTRVEFEVTVMAENSQDAREIVGSQNPVQDFVTKMSLCDSNIIDVQPAFIDEAYNEHGEIDDDDESIAIEDRKDAKYRLECIRKKLDDECISQDELLELQSLAEFIEDNDVQLLEAAGVPEGMTGKEWKKEVESCMVVDS